MPRYFKKNLPFAFIVFIVGIHIAHAQFSSSIGEIIEIEGTVEVSFKDGPWQKAKVKTQLKKGDRLRTGEFSKATVKGVNGSLQQIEEMTTIHFGASLQNAQAEPNFQTGNKPNV